MVNTIRRSLARYVSGGVLTVLLLAACGGGEIIAILQIVTPLAGTWKVEGVEERISFDGANDDAKFYQSKFAVTVDVSPAPPPACGSSNPLSGTLDNGKLTVLPNVTPPSTTPCMSGEFVNLRRLDLSVTGEAVKRVYLNDRVAVFMEKGVWVSESGKLRLKFNQPESVTNDTTVNDNVVGCDVSNVSAVVRFTGTMSGFNTATQAKPRIAELRGSSNALLFSEVEYVDGDTITLRNSGGERLTLNRKDETANCPA